MRRRQSWIVYLLVLTLLVAVATAVMFGVRGFVQQAERAEQLHQVIAAVESVKYGQRALEAVQRYGLLTGDPEVNSQVDTAAIRLRASLTGLGRELDIHPNGRTMHARVSELVDARVEQARAIADIAQSDGLAAAQRAIRSGEGAQLAQQAEDLLNDLQDDINGQLRRQQLQVYQGALRLQAVAIGGIAISLMVVAGLIWRVSAESRVRWIAEGNARHMADDLATSLAAQKSLNDSLGLLAGFASQLQSSRTLAEALDVGRAELPRLLPGIAGKIYLMRDSQHYAEDAMSWGSHAASSGSLVTPQDCWALRRGQPHCVDDVAQGNKCAHIEVPPPSQPASTACIPMQAQGHSLGFVYLSAPGPGDIQGVALAEMAAEHLSLALFNLRLQERLRNQSIRDPLTGLFNRRYLDESLSRELARCQRRGLPLSVFVIDIDHFKTFNDNHGHDAGDTVLKAFADLLRKRTREEDIACRMGGEEFVVICPELGLETAVERANEFRTALQALHVAHLNTTLPTITVSIGIAIAPQQGSHPDQLIKAADAALYLAKNNGRNRVEVLGSNSRMPEHPAKT
jgi:diguanylate cyclase (GGDEF)-like protein